MTGDGYYISTDKGYEIVGDKAEALLKAINDLNNRLTDIEEWHRVNKGIGRRIRNDLS